MIDPSSNPPTRRGLVIRHAPGALRGRIAVPGDKSISHRALILGGLAMGETRITGLLEGEDVMRTAQAMRALGAEVVRMGPGCWSVVGRGVGALVEPDDVLDMGNSGTAARLLCGALATHPLTAVMTGDASLRRRPMARVIEPMRQFGASFASRGGLRLPLAITGTGNAVPVHYVMPVASAQVKSAILLAGLNARGQTVVEEPEATRDHSEKMLRHFGAALTVEQVGRGRVIRLDGQPELRGAAIAVPADPSSAAFPLAAALMVPGSEIVLTGVTVNPLRAGLIAALRRMGADIGLEREAEQGGEPIADLVVRHAVLEGVDVPAEWAPSMIDEYPILAVVAASARGVTRLRGLGELRVKESNRLDATAAMLEANGVDVTIEGDDLLIVGTGDAPRGGGRVVTLMDHRLAMSGIVMGLAAREPVAIDDAGFIDTSFPGFVALMNALGAGIAG